MPGSRDTSQISMRIVPANFVFALAGTSPPRQESGQRWASALDRHPLAGSRSQPGQIRDSPRSLRQRRFPGLRGMRAAGTKADAINRLLSSASRATVDHRTGGCCLPVPNVEVGRLRKAGMAVIAPLRATPRPASRVGHGHLRRRPLRSPMTSRTLPALRTEGL